MKIIKLIIEILLAIVGYQETDPVKYCEVYKNSGCSHVDGMYCNFPDCEILIEFKSK